jgi:hypothetical protein
MKMISLAIILALLPIFSFLLQYFISNRNKKLKYFKELIPVMYLDWIFIPFNILVVYSIESVSRLVLWIALLTSFITNFSVHRYWYPRDGKPESYWFCKKSIMSQMNVTHMVYSSLQTAIILIFIISNLKLIFGLAACILLMVYFIMRFPSSLIMHKKWRFLI